MSREQRERRAGRIQRLFDRIRDATPAPPDDDLRAMARAASSQSRPLPPRIRPRRWPLEPRWTGVAGVALIVAIASGVGVGALIAPSSTAAPAPIGTGFLPEPGWTVLQTGSDATPERQALAVATNVRLHPEDDARGIRGSSGLPYSTLLRLPKGGVVIVALFTRRESEPWNDEFFPKRELPLSVREAMGSIPYGTQVRPKRPLGQYELRVTVGGHHVTLHFYFGTQHPSPQLIGTAQDQLERLVVASMSAGDGNPRHSATIVEPSAQSRVIDRTVACAISPGNPREIQVNAQSGTRLFGDRSKWKSLPAASFGDPLSTSPTSPGVSAGIWAGWPPVAEVGFPVRTEALRYSVRCRPSRSRVPLSSRGLSGGMASQVGDEYDCVVPGRILVRVRGVFYAPTSLRRWRPTRSIDQYVARGRARGGALAIRTESGRPIALATVHESGWARLRVGPTCGPSG